MTWYDKKEPQEQDEDYEGGHPSNVVEVEMAENTEKTIVFEPEEKVKMKINQEELTEQELKQIYGNNIIDSHYLSLQAVFDEALVQASEGKGKRHIIDDVPFEEQLICLIERAGLSYCEGQAVKKIFEAHRLEVEEAEIDLLGAINYIAANIIVRRNKI